MQLPHNAMPATGGAIQSHLIYGGQMQPWGQHSPAADTPTTGQQQSTWGSRGQDKAKPMMLDGEHVVPAVVVFGNGSKPDLKRTMQALDHVAASTVVAIHKIPTGAPRCVLHCKASNIQLAQTLVSTLQQANTRAAIYESRSPPPANGTVPKAQVAMRGLAKATTTAGLCRFFERGQHCPHLERNGRCNFICYSGPPGRN